MPVREHVHPSASMLYHLIMLKLSEQPHTGYSLAKSIEQSTGRRPSWGSIYPLLVHLKERELTTMSSQGRKKVYSITPAGKRIAQGFKRDHDALIQKLMLSGKTVCAITGDNPEMMLEIFERMRSGENPFGPVTTDIVELRDTILAMASDGRLKRNQQATRKILGDTKARLERLK